MSKDQKQLAHELECLEQAFRALWQYCENRIEWAHWREEWLVKNKDSKSVDVKNAKLLREFMLSMRHVPVVNDCLNHSDQSESKS
jgi:hypothetical protein